MIEIEKPNITTENLLLYLGKNSLPKPSPKLSARENPKVSVNKRARVAIRLLI